MNQIDAFKLSALSSELSGDISLLKNLVSEDNDDSSELVGQEINKLLNKQENLEGDYLGLIEERKKLRGFSNRDQLMDTNL